MMKCCRCFSLVPVLIGGLVADVSAADWPHFLGPNGNFHSAESDLNLTFPETGPKVLWEVERGLGHAGPVVAGGKVVLLHQIDQEEQVLCLEAETGETLWEHSYPVEVSQHFGIVDAPRSAPVIDVAAGLVYTLGNDGDLICLNLATGSVAWRYRLSEVFGESPFFFGYGSSPLVYEDKLIVQVGSEDQTLVAFDKLSGEIVWEANHEWRGSYASPVIMEIHGEDRILAFVGGKVKPPTGGLLCIDPTTGMIEDAFPWRSDSFTSVIAATPVPCGPNRVFISEDYGKGGVMLEYGEDFKARARWKSTSFGCQFQTPIYHQGTIYGFGGSGGLMVAVNAATGRLFWNEAFYKTTIPWEGRNVPISMGQAHLIHVDGGFLCLTENGSLIRMDLSPSGYQLGSKARLFYAPETWAPPALSEGRLYVTQNEFTRRLICYDLRVPKEKGSE